MTREWEVEGMLLRLHRVKTKNREGAVEGLTLGVEHVGQVADSHVPHEEGTLERSRKSTVDPDALRGCVSYDTPYAVAQHEDLTLAHDDGRTAKYLERAFNSETDTVKALIVTAIRRKLEEEA